MDFSESDQIDVSKLTDEELIDLNKRRCEQQAAANAEKEQTANNDDNMRESRNGSNESRSGSPATCDSNPVTPASVNVIGSDERHPNFINDYVSVPNTRSLEGHRRGSVSIKQNVPMPTVSTTYDADDENLRKQILSHVRR